jgi:hypothetical protein
VAFSSGAPVECPDSSTALEEAAWSKPVPAVLHNTREYHKGAESHPATNAWHWRLPLPHEVAHCHTHEPSMNTQPKYFFLIPELPLVIKQQKTERSSSALIERL